jgi:membrane-associated phospholipid phosphatase
MPPHSLHRPSHSGVIRTSRQGLLSLALLLAALGALALLANLDLPVALGARGAVDAVGGLRKFLSLAEVGGHGKGALMILVAAFTLSRCRWRQHPDLALRLVLATYAGGLASSLIKALVTRVRPRNALLGDGVYALDTFGRALLSPDASQTSASVLMSFPSGHAAVAAGLAAALCHLAPHGRWLFIGLALMACLQRLVGGAHYLSDVCFGAALGLLGAALILPSQRPLHQQRLP